MYYYFCFYGRALLALCGEEGEGKEEEEGEDGLLGIAWSWLAVAMLLCTKQKQVSICTFLSSTVVLLQTLIRLVGLVQLISTFIPSYNV